MVANDGVSLSPGSSGGEAASVSLPGTPGTYYFGACVEVVSGESNSGNNCSAGVQVVVVAAPPDLVVRAMIASKTNTFPSETISLTASVRNQGSGSSNASTTLRWYVSSNSTINSSDTLLGTDFVPSLGPNASGGELISISVPSTPGTYYFGACVDAVSGESSTTNNCSAGVRVVVFGIVDLILESMGVSKTNVSPSEAISITVSVKNQGSGPSSESAELLWYRSSDSIIARTDTSWGSSEDT